METNKKYNGFYTIDASLLFQSSKKPFHLEKRFKKGSRISSQDKAKLVEQRRQELLEQIRYTKHQNFLRVKKVANEVRERRKSASDGNFSVTHKKKLSAWSVLLNAFKELELPSPSSQETWLDFNDLSKLIHQPNVIFVTTKVLNVALKKVDDTSRQRARVLLTAYMMLMCPKEVLQNLDGDEEKRLHDIAKDMLTLFEVWLDTHKKPGATAARLAFADAWDSYNTRFEDWKSRDCKQLLDGMMKFYNELSELRQSVIAVNDGDETTGNQLERQLKGIEERIQKLGGPAALERLRRLSNSKEKAHDEPPDAEKQKAANSDMDDMTQLFKNCSTPIEGLTNEYLAHEVIMNPSFRLEPQNTLENQVRAVAKKAFFDKVAEDFENGTGDASLLSLIKEIQNRLITLANGTRMQISIANEINLQRIEQEMHQKSFDMQHMIHYVLDAASKMCAPIRDEEIEKALATHDMKEQLQHIFSILDNMSLDYANYRLSNFRPHLLALVVDYERDKFELSLKTKRVTLSRTEDWLNNSAHELCQLAAQRNPECVQPEKNNRPSHDNVYENAVVTLLGQSHILVDIDDLPETFKLDVTRMATFQNELQAITIVAALLLLARNYGRRTPAGLAARLFTMLEDGATTTDNLATEIIRSVDVSAGQRKILATMVDKTISHNNTVYSLFSRRVLSVIRSTIHHNKFVTDAVISGNGLEHVRNNLESLAIRIQRLTHHNKKVYSPWYDEIITNALDKYVVVSSSSSN